MNILKCKKCKKLVSVDERYFWRYLKDKEEMFDTCKSCAKDIIKLRTKKYLSDRWDKQGRSKRYNISIEEYLNMKENQNNSCAICGSAETAKYKDGRIKELSIDHNHKSGKVRGLLCARCNSAIGFFNDNVLVIEKALHYLNKQILESYPQEKETNRLTTKKKRV